MTPVAVWDAKRAGWGMAGVSAGLVALWAVLGGLEQLGQRGLRPFLETEYANVVFALLFPVVGAVVLARTPRHPLGALYCFTGFACALTLAVAAYGQRGLVDRPGSLPGAVAAGWVSSWIWMCGFLPLSTLGVLCFPDGRLPSRRWWPVAAGTGALLVVSVCTTALRPGPLENHPVRENPLGLPVPRSWLDLLSQPAWLWFVLACILASFAGLVTRYLHVAGNERERYHWFVVACALMVGSFAVPPRGGTAVIANLLVIVAMPLLPLSVGVAVLRSRLPHSAEGGLRRSFVYAWLLAVELSVYAVIIVSLDALLRGHARPLVTLLGAGAVAVLFQPTRLRLQRSTDRMLFGDRGDPYAVLAGLGRRLEAVGAAEEALPATASAIAQALRLPYVAIELPDDQPHLPTAVHGTRPAAEPLVFELTHTGENMGRLVVGRRHAREDLTQS